MKYIHIEGTDLNGSQIVLGCRRLGMLPLAQAQNLIRMAMDAGVNMFDHADIYEGGECERMFAKAAGMNASVREKMILQSKCAIRGGYYDFSKEHILASVDGILSRLNTDYLDVLLLHRPDPLMEPEEVAEAFDRLRLSGKVRYFGVSNQNTMQMELLQKYTRHKLCINQLQMGLAHTPLIDSGMAANLDIGADCTGSMYEYSRLKEITLQAWAPVKRGVLLDREKYGKLNAVLDRLAEKYGVTSTTIAVAWLTRLPANVQVIMGTTKPERLLDGCAACEVKLERKEWYELYAAAGNVIS